VAYVGGFSRNRLLLPLIEAVHGLPNVHLLLWGDGHQRAAVEEAAAAAPNVRYLGWLPADRVPLHTCLADMIYYCLLPDYPGAAYNAPNTLSNAMAAGRPIIANDVGDLGRIVRQTRCGVLLAEVTPGAIRQAIEDLRDPSVRRQLGEAGRVAAENHYNWTAARRQLLEVYARLIGIGST
jgi:glycosyltransferase involved in cell wall biosynthesis